MRYLLPILLAGFMLGSCGKRGPALERGCNSSPAATDLCETPVSQAELWADSLMSGMTLKQQVAQLLLPALYASTDYYTMERLKWYAEEVEVGGILLLKGDGASAAAMSDTLAAIRNRKPLSPGFFVAVDAENGLGMRFADAPKFPWNYRVDRDADTIIFLDYGKEVGREAAVVGVNMILGPVVDITRIEEPELDVMKTRSLGSDQLRVADLSIAYAKGLESRGVVSVMKHFPGHGPTGADSHKELPVVDRPESEIYTVDLLPFRKGVSKGISGIMVGHIWALALDSVERPASFSPVIIKGLLREEMGFEGIVMVDAVSMGGAEGFSGEDAIRAGADMLIAPVDTQKELDAIMASIADGRLPVSRVEESCRRILMCKYLHGIQINSRPEGEGSIRERLYREAPEIKSRLMGGEAAGQ